jgi:hypothetical protein
MDNPSVSEGVEKRDTYKPTEGWDIKAPERAIKKPLISLYFLS